MEHRCVVTGNISHHSYYNIYRVCLVYQSYRQADVKSIDNVHQVSKSINACQPTQQRRIRYIIIQSNNSKFTYNDLNSQVLSSLLLELSTKRLL